MPAYKLHSPLESLARHTSARKPQPSTPPYSPEPTDADTQYAYTQTLYYDPQSTPPRQATERHYPPNSPLLHSHFARDSTATASSNDNNSYLHSIRTSIESRNVYQDPELEYRYYDDESIYSDNTGPALRDSWQSHATSGTVRGGAYATNFGGVKPIANNMSGSQPPSPISPVPTVIVSSPSDTPVNPEYTNRAGRTPIVKPITSNFSRPVRPPIIGPPLDNEQKRRVLERNARRAPSPNLSQDGSQATLSSHLNPQYKASSMLPSASNVYAEPSSSSRSPTINYARQQARSPSPHNNPSVTPSSYPPPSSHVHMASAQSLSPSMLQPMPTSVSLPNRPPSLRSGSPVSLYSTYSFYQLDSASPSPTGGEFRTHSPNPAPTTSKRQASPSPTPLSPTSDPYVSPDQTAQEFLQLGIQHHEANRLKESAVCFERSAKENGGCGVGMLMWGLALRHGWGCKKNEKLGFKWLRQAAESAVKDLENARAGGGVDTSAVQVCRVLESELPSDFWFTFNFLDRTCTCYIRSWAVFFSRLGCRKRPKDGCCAYDCIWCIRPISDFPFRAITWLLRDWAMQILRVILLSALLMGKVAKRIVRRPQSGIEQQ